MYYVRDVVKVDRSTRQDTVVQVDFYSDKSLNKTLVESFVFTRSAPEGKVSTLDLLAKVREAAETDRLENIFCIIANYGQGKTHFAVMLANYFGQPVDSEEFKLLMERMERIRDVTDDASTQTFAEFRKSHPPYLVVRLRGDRPEPLDAQFLRAVKDALREHNVDEVLPLWYDRAASWLERLADDATLKNRAAEILHSNYGTDLPTLVQETRRCSPSVYETVIDLHRKLYSTTPNFEGEYAPADLLEKVVERFCRQEKKWGGVLILFDEFSLFIQKYAHNQRAAGMLQNFLESIQRCRPDALFVAFAQHDPLSVVDSLSIGQQQISSVRKELERIRTRLNLYSRMEQVVEGYLRRPDARWDDIYRELQDFADVHLYEACKFTLESLPNLYSEDKEWNLEQFEEVVGKGCYPLHPLTTAILCNINLQGEFAQTETPRTILGFVQEKAVEVLDLPIFHDKNPTWIYAVGLVDYFGKMLPPHELHRYQDALRRLEEGWGDEYRAVLKAILLISVAGIRTKREKFEELVQHLSGCSLHQVRETLKALKDRLILHDDGGICRFWASGGDPARLIRRRDESFSRRLAPDDISILTRDEPVPLEVSWGHPADWQPRVIVCPRQWFTTAYVKSQAPLYRKKDKAFEVVQRALIVRLFADTEDDVEWYRTESERIIDEAFGDMEYPPVVLLIRPTKPMGELARLARWQRELQQMSERQRQEIGVEICADEKRLVDDKIKRLDSDFRQFTKASALIVPKAYRSRLEESNPSSLSEAITKLYSCAYPHVPQFSNTYELNDPQKSRPFKSELASVCRELMEGRLRDFIEPNYKGRQGPGKDFVEQILRREWQIVDSRFSVIEPLNANIKRAWCVLQQAFDNDELSNVGDVVLRLMNPPYGYGPYQAAVLLSAWCGYNRARMEVSINGRLVKHVSELWRDWKGQDLKGSRAVEDFIWNVVVNSVTLRKKEQRDDQVARLADEILSRQHELSTEEAQKVILELRQYITAQKEANEAVPESIEEAVKVLQEDLNRALSYDDEVRRVRNRAKTASDVGILADAYKKLRTLPEWGIVTPTSPPVEHIRQEVVEKLEACLDTECRKVLRISDLQEVTEMRNRLQQLVGTVREVDLPNLETQIREYRDKFEERVQQLELEAKERELIGQIAGIEVEPGLSLNVLRKYWERLSQMQPMAESTRSECDAKKRQVQQAIDELLHQIQAWEREIEQVYNENDARQLHREIASRALLYKGTPEEDKVGQLIQECETIVKIYSIPMPQTRRELEDVESSLTQYLETSADATVRKAADRKRSDIQEHVRRLSEKASRWLKQKRDEAISLDASALPNLLRELDQPPEFLEDEALLREARKQVEERIEADAYTSIRSRLTQIRDRQKLIEIRDAIDSLLRQMSE